MSYKSPIEIISGKMKNQLENDVYSVVQSYGIKVDKDALVKALEYDRNQYQQGYADAKAELERKKGEWIKHENPTLGHCMKIIYECSVCHIAVGCEYFVRRSFCPSCGAEMMR